MGFPTKVNKTTASGRPGALANNNPVVYLAGSPVADSAGVVAGNFAFYVSSESRSSYTSEVYSNTRETGDTGAPAGLVSAEAIQTYIDGLDDATLTIKAGQPLTIYKRADVFAVATTTVEIGASVYANISTGAIEFTADAATNVLTDYKVIRAAAANDICIISNN